MVWSGGTYTRSAGANEFVNDAAASVPIEAAIMDASINEATTGINSCLNKDGSNAATGNLNLGGFRYTNSSYALAGGDLVCLAQLQAAVPPGVIFDYGGASAPTGFFLCQGGTASRTAYAALFAVIGTTYGAGDGSTTFTLPDFRQRFALGKAASGTGSTLGGTGGGMDHTHTVPNHVHTVDTGGVSALIEMSGSFIKGVRSNLSYTSQVSAALAWGAAADACTFGAAVRGSTDNSGATTTAANNPPYLVINKIIKY